MLSHQVDEVSVEYAGEEGQSKMKEGHGRRRPVGQRSPQRGEEDRRAGTIGEDPEEVTTKDSS